MSFVSLAVIIVELPSLLVTLIAAFILLGTGAIIYSAVRIAGVGPAPLPRIPFVLGASSVIGAIAFDGLATLLKSPDLAREGSAFAQVLLEHWPSRVSVILYGALFQCLLAIAIVSLWGAFLKHSQVLIASALRDHDRSLWDFLRAAVGGAHLTWRQYLLPFRLNELPSAYHFLWLLTIGSLAVCQDRWRHGLEWLGVRVCGGALSYALIAISAFLAYFLWLRSEYRRGQAA